MKPPRRLFRSRQEPPVYLVAVERAARQRPDLVRRGTVTMAVVTHRSECPMPSGRGPCDCSESDITVELKPLMDPAMN